ncbi:MAG: thiamine pyrophosphate-dependent enzyme [Patescibacteria group bacterium]
MEEILTKQKGKKIMLLGNDAVVRGALESGVQFVTTYPGTPASEVGNTFFRIAEEAGVYFEYSTNEIVALEVAAGASFSGLRTMMAMKNFGVNVASDFLLPLCYSGVKGEMVILVADDPSCWSSAQTEENTRGFGELAHIPIIEPSTPQECKDFTKLAFKLSGQFKLPIIVRETTRLALQSAPVELDEIIKGEAKGEFVKDPHQFSTMPPRVLEMKNELLAKIEELRKISEKSSINKVINKKLLKTLKLGIITSGVSYLYVEEALKELDIKLPILKLGFFNPLPEKKIGEFIKDLKEVLIVEELEPFLEREVERLAKNTNYNLKIIGKELIPITGELRPEHVIQAIAELTKHKTSFDFKKHLKNFKKVETSKRFPQLCQNCPYWLTFTTVKRSVPKGTIFGGEIGCYMLAAFPPHEMQDYLFCMGSSVSIAHGIKKASPDQKIVAFVGDSSFFHAGIPALINAVINKSNMLVIVMDNSTTAMTGQQPHPGNPSSGKPIEIEDVVKSLGVKYVKKINPINAKEFEATIKEFLDKDEVSVIVSERPCIRI